MNNTQRSIATAQLASLCYSGAMIYSTVANAYNTLAVYLVGGLLTYEQGKLLFSVIRKNA